MSGKLTTLNLPELRTLDKQLDEAYARKAILDAEIAGLKNRMVTRLQELEKETGKKIASENWALTRSKTTYKRTPSITMMRRYLSNQIIDMCCTTRRVEQQPLARRTKKK